MIEQRANIQFVSDIHLEMYDNSNFHPEEFVTPGVADLLVLAGDIGYPEESITLRFIDWCSKNWRYVLWIPGNHEFYCRLHSTEKYSVLEKVELLLKLCGKFPNVYYLNSKYFDIPNTRYRILGCTLWSDIPNEKIELVEKYMNDYRLIYADNNIRATPFHMKQWFQDDVLWLQQNIQIAKDIGKELIIITHHLPTQQLVHSKYEHHPLNCCFASNLDSMIRYPIRAWICGHSHMSNQVDIHNVLCTLNPYGYPGEYERDFSRKKVIQINENTTSLHNGDDIILQCEISSSSESSNI